MKRGVLLLTISALMASSCGNSNAKGEQKPQQPAAEESLLTEQPEQIPSGKQAYDPSDSMAAGIEGSAVQTGDTTRSSVIVKGGTILLTRATFLKYVWNYEKSPQQWVFLGEKPAIIDFYADWCGPCKIASPILEEVSHEFAGQISVYKIDTQKEQELADVFGIRSIPAFLYIPRNGKPTMMAGIGRSKEDTKKMFVDNINNILLKTNQ